ncbi:MAG: hypothetical protein [Vetruanivirus porcinprimi]|uniref:Uncharacterized protein n=1 Tax=phage Lak_Megaphage_RVC_AP1_GC26 TaxID=3109224 RepID=A0ABZ0Z4M6_9CAUD|nr:MAG: hypothetical protein [phage Lak_Megaphage_RVC_AP1_GC26]
MKNVSKTVKKQLNESETVDEYKTRMNNYINNWFETAIHTGNENLDNEIKSKILECAAKFNPHIKDYINSDDYKDRSYRARVRVLKPHFDSLDIQTKIRTINACSKILLSHYDGRQIDKFDYRKASTEGQDIIATISDKAFLEPILDTDDFKKAAKMTSLRLFAKTVSQPRFLGNAGYCVSILTGLVNKIKEINND